MEALLATYGDCESDSDVESGLKPIPSSTNSAARSSESETQITLPPPPVHLLNPPRFTVHPHTCKTKRVRSFPHVDGNYALHVYLPVHIPRGSRIELLPTLKRVASLVPGLHAVESDILLHSMLDDDGLGLDELLLGTEFHISLGRTVPIRAHQIDSMVTMLRQKLSRARCYDIDFTKWEVYVNDDRTRTFLSIDAADRGLSEILEHVKAVNEVYRLHNLPEFYKDPRPHISVAWATGNAFWVLKRAIFDGFERGTLPHLSDFLFTSKFAGIRCKIGNKTHDICKAIS